MKKRLLINSFNILGMVVLLERKLILLANLLLDLMLLQRLKRLEKKKN
jgi:hypothetical protein